MDAALPDVRPSTLCLVRRRHPLEGLFQGETDVRALPPMSGESLGRRRIPIARTLLAQLRESPQPYHAVLREAPRTSGSG